MPELPEVEVVRAGLQPVVTAATVTRVEVAEPRSLRRHRPTPGADAPADFVARLTGARMLGAVRRGKFIWLPFVKGDETASEALVVHLGMSGQVLVRHEDVAEPRHVRVGIAIDGPAGEPFDLLYADQRIFGSLAIEPLQPLDAAGGFSGGASGAWVDGIPRSVAHIARDPLDPLFDEDAWRAGLRARRSELKRVLLDQSFVSGIGNIYADEALWAAQLHFAQPAATLTPAETTRLLAAIRVVLQRALAEGGTSFDALYVDVNGQSGYFSRMLTVYGRAGEPCNRCGAPIAREPFMNRSSYLCARCQRRR